MNEKQQQAILLLAAGKTCSQVAEHLQVTPKTISTWRATPEFRAELNTYLQDIKTAHAERLRSLCGMALDTIEDCLNDGELSSKDRLSASFKLLELGRVSPSEIGETDAAKIHFEDMLNI
jgi:Homeodomain-like domain-containing protein